MTERFGGRHVPRRVLIAALAVLLAAAALAVLALAARPHGPAAPDFTLTDQDGRAYRLAAHRGHAIALFFGYTSCPDVCPTTLAALARARRRLGDAARRLDVVFVTVDPARDSPARLRRYLRLFDPSFVGLTGDEAQLAGVYRAYKVYHQRLPGSARDYPVAHSTTVELIGPDGRRRGTFDWSDDVATMTADLRRVVS